MLRFKTISSLLFYAAASLVFFVFLLHFFTPQYQSDENHPLVPFPWKKSKLTTTVFIPAEPHRQVTPPAKNCRENLITIEQFRTRTIVRGVIVRFPSSESDYYFVQFRWFYRSWIESEMFTLDRWRTDLIVLIDDQFPNKTRQMLEHLDCHVENHRNSRRQISRCILVQHQFFSQRTQTQRQTYIDRFLKLDRVKELDPNVDRLVGIYDYVSHLNESRTMLYDFIMVTTMNTFLTTQFGKYIPIRCAFLIGTEPDYTTWYAKTSQILQFLHTLLEKLKEDNQKLIIDFPSTIHTLEDTLTFSQSQVDIPCDSKTTTYRTSVYHIKCYAHSSSLFSEKMFREGSYDGFEKEPFNIYIAREYATLMALQSKVLSLDQLHLLAVNATRRQVYT